MGLDYKNLSVRTISGLVYAGLLVGAIVLGPWAMAIVGSVFAVIACYELEGNSVGRDNPSNWKLTWYIDAAALVFLIFSFAGSNHSTALCACIFIALLFLRFFMQLFIKQENVLKSISLFPFSLLYIGVPLSMLVAAVASVSNPWIIVCAIAMIWINDTGAYLVGCTLGSHKMFPRLSPKKSWEGFLGGLAFNIGAAFIFYYCFDLRNNDILANVDGWIFIGLCVTAFATLGDLFESMIKRSLGIKDFGTIIPGHGGVLDRIDSLLFVVPCLVAAIFVGLQMFWY